MRAGLIDGRDEVFDRDVVLYVVHAVQHQPTAVTQAIDYPSHLGAHRHELRALQEQ